jgi:ribonuclease R
MTKRRREPRAGGARARTDLPLRERVSGLLGELGRPASVRDLGRKLDLGHDEQRELEPLLERLIEAGELVRIRDERIGLPSHMNLVVGRLQCSPAGFGFVVPERRAAGQRDVFVSAGNLKEALHGDRVVARLEKSGPRGPEGRVIRVLERSLQRLVGRYEDDGRMGGRVVPFDRRVLHELLIPPGEAGQARGGQMVTAEITRPPTSTRNPVGRVLEVLGRLEDPGVDLRVIQAKYGLTAAFPPEVEEEAGRVPREVRPQDTQGRTDFRGATVVTVDPETARDHDDAISLERRGGGWRLGVHIADVAHYVRRHTPLDEEAYRRGTSVYFPETVVPMLPHALSSGICSLVEGQDRLTQSVVLDIDARGRVQKAEFHDGVIRSAARLSYQQAQAMVDGDEELRARFAHVAGLVRDMDALAREMRRRRYERGSLDFDVPEPKVRLGPAGEITAIEATERLDSMRAIEEFMLAANEAVAARLHASGAGALFRIHEPPDPEKVREFADLVASFGYRVPGDLEDVSPQDLQRIIRQVQGRPEERLISYLLLRTMKLARYHQENLGHFGLATRMYAHFTSPIRRYPDLVVHRALRALRHREDPAVAVAPPDALPVMGVHLSETERKAAEAERELLEWKKVRFMADKLGESFSGTVTGVQSFGLFVELDEIYVQGLVHVSSMSDDYYLFNERAHLLQGENTGKTYRLGDAVRVQVARVDLGARKVDFALVDVLERAGSAGRRAAVREPRAQAAGRRERPEPRGRGPGRRSPRGRGGPRPRRRGR